jgi:hypothetical protein
MRMAPDTYVKLRGAIGAIWTPEKHRDHTQFVTHEGKAKDIAKRVRWDWFYYAKGSEIVRDAGLDMDHIDTALRQIILGFETEAAA